MRTAALCALSLCLAAGPVLAAQPDVPASSADASQIYYAWANVTRVDPVYHTVSVSNPYQQCQEVAPASPSTTGHAAGARPAPATQCQKVESVSQERRIVGYNVEYRFHGRVYMSQLNYDPGERLRVAVSVTPAD